MYNWSVDTNELKKDEDAYAIWHLEQLINYGLGGEKIKKSELQKYWNKLFLDPIKKRYFAFLLWGKLPR